MSNLRECPACEENAFYAVSGALVSVECYGCMLRAGYKADEKMAREVWNALPRRSDLDEACRIIIQMLSADMPKVVRDRARAFLEKHAKRSEVMEKPEVVCLCGSTRFMEAFFDEGWRLTLEHKIVLSVGVCKHAEHHGGEALGQDVANRLDELHFRKIDMADRVHVLNVGGYIGPSTRKEIEYAQSLGKPITYLEGFKRSEGK